jgi:AcrR family transcriptional regulator
MERRAIQREQTRDRLIQAVQELIIERGSTAIQMADIARRADVATRTAYNHFSSTDELLGAAMATITDEFAKLAPAPVNAEQIPPKEAFRNLIREWYDELALESDKLEALLSIRNSPELAEALSAARQLRLTRIRDVLVSADEQGLLRLPLEDALAVSYCMTGYASWASLVPQFGLKHDRATLLVTDTLCHAIFK